MLILILITFILRCFLETITQGLTDVVKNLIKKGVDIETRDEEGYTALHYGVEFGSIDVVELLVKKGVDVEAMTNKGADLEVDLGCCLD
ncbi:ankyrin repeat and protein kinase domain-containing protein 1-like protein [Tanacetum coccineum]